MLLLPPLRKPFFDVLMAHNYQPGGILTHGAGKCLFGTEDFRIDLNKPHQPTKSPFEKGGGR